MKLLYLIVICLLSPSVDAQQRPDTSFSFDTSIKKYGHGSGPQIRIDNAHNNFHTRDGGFYAFSKLLRNDGYTINETNTTLESVDSLKNCDVLVIVNAIHVSNQNTWALPTPSAFTKKEIKTINSWVYNGGSLLLIADHMPFAGAATNLAHSFGFGLVNGFAKTSDSFWPPAIFNKDSTLLNTIVTEKGEHFYEIDSVATFTGSAFTIPEKATGILKFASNDYILCSDTAWVFDSSTKKTSLKNYYQGAIMNYGKGKIAVFGEAAMFTAQISNGTRVGLNSEYAPQNALFTLNIMHWLDKQNK